MKLMQRLIPAALAASMLVTAGTPVFAADSAAKAAKAAKGDKEKLRFEMVRSPGIVKANCVTDAKAIVRVKNDGPVEIMDVTIWGLPAKTDFDFFVIQTPNAPFGMSWYQGDIETNEYGFAHQRFIGRFNVETFIVASGPAPAPATHATDATINPTTAPIHTYHLGLWFNSPDDAVKAGCPGNVTPFNGEHNAGVQVLNTANFPDLAGPLGQLKP